MCPAAPPSPVVLEGRFCKPASPRVARPCPERRSRRIYTACRAAVEPLSESQETKRCSRHVCVCVCVHSCTAQSLALSLSLSLSPSPVHKQLIFGVTHQAGLKPSYSSHLWNFPAALEPDESSVGFAPGFGRSGSTGDLLSPCLAEP